MNISQHCFMPSTQLVSGYYNSNHNVLVTNSTNYSGSCFPRVFLRSILSFTNNYLRVFDSSNKNSYFYNFPLGKQHLELLGLVCYCVRVANQSSTIIRNLWSVYYPSVLLF